MTTWRRSSLCSFGNCVEVAQLPDGEVAVRDTKDGGVGPVLVFDASEWQAFVDGVKAGEFNLPGEGA